MTFAYRWLVLGDNEGPVDDDPSSKKKRSRHAEQSVKPASISGHSAKLSHRSRGGVETQSAVPKDRPIDLTSHSGREPSDEHPPGEMNDAAKALLDAAKYDSADYTTA